MLNIVIFFLDLVDQYILWLYGACFLVILFYLGVFQRARRDRVNTVFTIEREVATHREGRALSGIGAMLGVAVILTALRYYVIPVIDLEQLVEPTPTSALVLPTRELLTPTAEPTFETATATPRPRPTSRPLTTPAPVQPTAAPAPACPDVNVRITSPGMGEVVSGRVAVRGVAQGAQFQFFKVEYGQGENPTTWHVLNDIHRLAVADGVLEEFNTLALPNGVYWLQLVVVDTSGNFPPPCQVRVVVQN